MKNTEKTNETRRIPALLVLAALSAIVLAPVTAQSVSGDFEVNGTVLVKYRGSEENVVIPDYLGLTEIGLNAFRGTKVKSVTIPPGVTSIGGSAFSDCGDLTGISIPEGVSFIDHNAFQHCYRLEELTLPASLTTLGSGYIPAIYNCSALRAVHVREGNRHFTSMKGVLFTRDMKTLIKYPARMPDTEYAIPGTVTTIEDHAFDDSRNLRVLLIPPSVTCINGTNTFSNSYSFRVFRVDPANPAFADVDGVLFDKEITRLIRYPEEKEGTAYTVPATVKTIGERAFWYTRYWDTRLRDIRLPEGLVSIENMAFYGCNSLTSISIPDSVTSIGGDAFYWCIKLKTVSLSRKTKFEADSFRKDTELVYRD